MDYHKFKNYILENFIETLGEYIDVTGVDIDTMYCYKQNVGKKEAVRVNLPRENGEPIFYLQDMFERYQEYVKDLPQETEAAKKVIEQYAPIYVEKLDEAREQIKQVSLGKLQIWRMKNLRMCLIGYDNNKEMLQYHPHRKFLDMAVIYRLLLSDSSSVCVTNEMMVSRGLSEEQLYSGAMRNLETNTTARTINEYLAFLGQTDETGMIILSCEDMKFGAASILSKSVWTKALEICDANFYLLPSSIHEFLAIPDLPQYVCYEKDSCMESFHTMVREVNDSEVEAEDILTYSVYYYDKDSGQISVLKSGM